MRANFGSTFDFELDLKIGTGYPTEAMLSYGYELGYQFHNSLYLAGALDWSVIYPRQFNFAGKKLDFFAPPISLWWVPLTNAQAGYAFNQHWLASLGLVYYWGMSTSLRYRFSENIFCEFKTVIWMDRLFNTGGFYGGGFDNLMLSTGLGYKF